MAWTGAPAQAMAGGSLRALCRLSLVTGAILFGATAGLGQTHRAIPALLTHQAAAAAFPASPDTARLIVPSGTPLRVSLIRKVRIRKVGAPVEARVLEPVYAFDRVVVPAGSEVTGEIVRIVPVSKLLRTEAILNGDFTPLKTAHVAFDTLVLKNGTRMTLATEVLPGTRNIVRLITEPNGKKPNLVSQARRAIAQRWRNAIDEVKAPGKLHRLKELALSELPYRRQYLPAGTVFDAELTRPLDFGTATLNPKEMADVGQVPPQDSIVDARLLTALDSATAAKGAPVKALVTKPLFFSKNNKRLLIPEGTELEGNVVQVRAARDLHRNGRLRFVIRKMELPSGARHRVDASVEGLEVGRGQGLALDSEGGTSVTQSKARYFTTALSIGIAATTTAGESDHHMGDLNGASGTADASTNGLAGASGYRLVGLALGVGVHSRALGIALGIYGAARSIYFNFLARGRNVVLAKDTPMEIAFGPPLGPADK